MSENSSKHGRARTFLVLGVVVALATVGVFIVRTNGSDDGRDRNIAGGANVAISAAPYQVALLSYALDANGERNGDGYACGGAIISAQWVLTADHCIWRDSAGRVHPEHVAVGTGDSRYWTAINSPSVRLATRILPARGVVGAWPDADLLLIKVDVPFEFSASVRPAALPIGLDNASWPAKGATGLITGWGVTLDNAVRTTLRGVTMKVNAGVFSTYCVDDENYAYFWQNVFEPAQHLCLLRPSTDVMASACSGDSGGPFAVTVGEVTVLAGVASKASRDSKLTYVPGSTVCTGYTPNLYERVVPALDWIIPGAVEGLTGSAVDGDIALRWDVPTRTPAVEISDYVVEYRQAGANEWSIVNDGVSTSPTATIENVTRGANIEVRVAAVNDVNALDATMRQFASVDVVVGPPPTTTSTSTTSTSTTSAPTIQMPPPTVASATTSATVVAAPSTTTQSVVTPVNKGGDEDTGFSQPKVAVPAELTTSSPTPSTGPSVPVRPTPAVGTSLTALQIADLVGVPVPTGASATISVAKASAKVCRASGAAVAFLAKGKCRATLRIIAKSKPAKKKNVSLTVP